MRRLNKKGFYLVIQAIGFLLLFSFYALSTAPLAAQLNVVVGGFSLSLLQTEVDSWQVAQTYQIIGELSAEQLSLQGTQTIEAPTLPNSSILLIKATNSQEYPTTLEQLEAYNPQFNIIIQDHVEGYNNFYQQYTVLQRPIEGNIRVPLETNENEEPEDFFLRSWNELYTFLKGPQRIQYGEGAYTLPTNTFHLGWYDNKVYLTPQKPIEFKILRPTYRAEFAQSARPENLGWNGEYVQRIQVPLDLSEETMDRLFPFQSWEEQMNNALQCLTANMTFVTPQSMPSTIAFCEELFAAKILFNYTNDVIVHNGRYAMRTELPCTINAQAEPTEFDSIAQSNEDIIEQQEKILAIQTGCKGYTPSLNPALFNTLIHPEAISFIQNHYTTLTLQADKDGSTLLDTPELLFFSDQLPFAQQQIAFGSIQQQLIIIDTQLNTLPQQTLEDVQNTQFRASLFTQLNQSGLVQQADIDQDSMLSIHEALLGLHVLDTS